MFRSLMKASTHDSFVAILSHTRLEEVVKVEELIGGDGALGTPWTASGLRRLLFQ